MKGSPPLILEVDAQKSRQTNTKIKWNLSFWFEKIYWTCFSLSSKLSFCHHFCYCENKNDFIRDLFCTKVLYYSQSSRLLKNSIKKLVTKCGRDGMRSPMGNSERPFRLEVRTGHPHSGKMYCLFSSSVSFFLEWCTLK